MFRLSRNIYCKVNRKVWLNLGRIGQRWQSGQQQQQRSSGAGAGTVVTVTLGGAVLGFAGIVGYASWSPQNRKVVDENVPGMTFVTDALLGSSTASPPPSRPAYTPPVMVPPAPRSITPAPAPALTSAAKEQSLMTKKIEREQKKRDVQEQEAAKVPAKAPAVAVSRTGAAVLAAAMKEASGAVTAAIQAGEDASDVVARQAAKAIQDLDGGVKDSVRSVAEAAVKAAEAALTKATARVSSLDGSIAAAEASSDGAVTVASVADARAMHTELAGAVTSLRSRTHAAAATMHNLEVVSAGLREGRGRLSGEVAALLPDVGGAGSEADPRLQLQLMLGHACNKMKSLEQALAEQKALGGRQKGGDGGGVSEAVLQEELDRLRHQLTLQHRGDLSRQKDELEAEVRGQLKRQAAAHAEHLNDALSTQQLLLNTRWEDALYDELSDVRDMHYKDLATVDGRLQGLQNSMKDRANIDRAAYASRDLWLACYALRSSLRLGREGAASWQEQLLPLQPQLAAIHAAAGGSDEFVASIIGVMEGGAAAGRGVYTEEALRHRFSRVATVAVRVGMVPENGGSLLRYLLSYVQSVLLVSASARAKEHSDHIDEAVDLRSLNAFDIVNRARECLDRDDLTECVRWLNQLTGEAARVSADWLTEARLTLESRQVADVLMAYAGATVATAL